VNSPESLRESPSSRIGGWTKQRIVFLSISAALILGLLIWAREVLLPFILGIILAYVLTPLVVLCERAKVPRAAAILIVYFATFGLMYLSVATIAPRIVEEGQKLAADAPKLARQISTQWGPRFESWAQGVLEKTRLTEAPPPAPTAPDGIEIHQRPDGTLQVHIGSGLDIVQQGPGHWRVGPVVQRPSTKFNVAELAEKSVEELMGYVKRNALELLRFGHSLVRHVSRGIFLLFMTLMVAGYIMHTREEIIGFFRSLLPPFSRIGFDRLLWRMDKGLSGVVRGQLLICLVNGVLSAIGFWIFDLKYWPILSIVAGVMSIVPIFGSILSSIPAVVIGLTQDFWTALWVLLWIVGIHQIEANLLNPKIIGVAAKIHPVLVVLALIIGEHFFGLWGALLAVPTLSLAQSLFNHFRFESMPDAPPDSLLPPTGGGGRIPTPVR
jgi:predicted PurR-regulated permease PerM